MILFFAWAATCGVVVPLLGQPLPQAALQQADTLGTSDSTQVNTNPSDSGSASGFYKKIKQDLYKRRLTKWLYKSVFRDQYGQVNTPEAQDFVNPYLDYEGKTVGRIRIKRLDIFGTSVDDTTRIPKKWVARTANKFHIKTGAWVIRSNLLFREGEVISAEDLYQSERLIRQLRFIRDARIIVEEDMSTPDSILVTVVVKDVYPISADFSPQDINAAEFSIDHRNLFGFGHELDNAFEYDQDDNSYLGYQGRYLIPNISGTFWSAQAEYAKTDSRDAAGLKVSRGFLTAFMKYAGGLEASRQRLNFFREVGDSLFVIPYEFDEQGLWLGRAYRLASKKQANNNLRLIIAGHVSNTQFNDRPVVNVDTNRFFHNRWLLLGGIGLTQRNYIKDRLIFGVGRTEDIPAGYKLKFTFGQEYGEFRNRFYLGGNIAKGGYIKGLGYLNTDVNIGGFYNGGLVEEGVFKVNTFFFSDLFNRKGTSLRQFLTVDYTHGIRRLPDEFIDIRNRNGVRGLNSNQLRGSTRLAINMETVAFTKTYFVGFRVAVFGFMDFGWIGESPRRLFDSNTFQGYGVGLRLRNDNLAFNTFQLRFGFYPNTPPDADMIDFNFSSLPRFQATDFDFQEPEVLRFE